MPLNICVASYEDLICSARFTLDKATRLSLCALGVTGDECAVTRCPECRDNPHPEPGACHKCRDYVNEHCGALRDRLAKTWHVRFGLGWKKVTIPLNDSVRWKTIRVEILGDSDDDHDFQDAFVSRLVAECIRSDGRRSGLDILASADAWFMREVVNKWGEPASSGSGMSSDEAVFIAGVMQQSAVRRTVGCVVWVVPSDHETDAATQRKVSRLERVLRCSMGDDDTAFVIFTEGKVLPRYVEYGVDVWVCVTVFHSGTNLAGSFIRWGTNDVNAQRLMRHLVTTLKSDRPIIHIWVGCNWTCPVAIAPWPEMRHDDVLVIVEAKHSLGLRFESPLLDIGRFVQSLRISIGNGGLLTLAVAGTWCMVQWKLTFGTRNGRDIIKSAAKAWQKRISPLTVHVRDDLLAISAVCHLCNVDVSKRRGWARHFAAEHLSADQKKVLLSGLRRHSCLGANITESNVCIVTRKDPNYHNICSC